MMDIIMMWIRINLMYLLIAAVLLENYPYLSIIFFIIFIAETIQGIRDGRDNRLHDD